MSFSYAFTDDPQVASRLTQHMSSFSYVPMGDAAKVTAKAKAAVYNNKPSKKAAPGPKILG